MLHKELDDIQIDLMNNIDYLSEWYHLGSVLVQFGVFSILFSPFPSLPPTHPSETSSRGLRESSSPDFDTAISKRSCLLKFVSIILMSRHIALLCVWNLELPAEFSDC